MFLSTRDMVYCTTSRLKGVPVCSSCQLSAPSSNPELDGMKCMLAAGIE